MQIALLQICFVILLVYFFGEFFVKILTKIKILNQDYNTLTIKFLISLSIINLLIIYGLSLNNISKFTFVISSIYFIYFLHEKLQVNKKKNSITNYLTFSNFFILFTTIFFLIKIIIEPVQLWDARSIWFYSGKIIYFNDGYLFENFQNDFCNKCDYLLYPKLIPSLTAYIAKVFGYWNDYITKLSLFLLLLPVLFFLKDEFRNFLNFFLSLILLIYATGFFIWNGYLDGYLAIYMSISYLCLIRFIENKKNYYFFISFLCLSILINLKIESFFYCISVLFYLIATNNFYVFKKIFNKENIFILLLIFLPIVIWWLRTFFDYADIKTNPNILTYSFYEFIKILFLNDDILGSRFNNYFIFVLNFVFIESKIIYIFLLQFIILIYAKIMNLETEKTFNITKLNILPLMYTLIITLFYFYIGYSRGLGGIESMIIASFDRLTLAAKSLFAVNILLLASSYKFNTSVNKND